MYQPPHIDASGPHIPLYTDIRDDLLAQAREIFGEDLYLEPDSQDYQLIAAFAEKLSDVNELAVMVYNNRAPMTAVGAGLDGVLKLNGLQRKKQTHSICALTLEGEAGARIYNGMAADTNDEKWGVGDVVIPASRCIEVMATCQRSGAVYADTHTITHIAKPTRGWFSVTNKQPATPGKAVESDAFAKARQATSTANPSKTVLEGTVGGIAALLNVTRYRVYENDRDTPDENGIPGHHICAVVEGGSDLEVAKVIYLRKTPGGGTFGDVQVQIETPIEGLDAPKPVCFYRPAYLDVCVEIRIKQLPGYVSQTALDLQANVRDYLNSLRIGENLTVSALYVPAMAATPDIAAPVFSIRSLKIGRTAATLSTNDIEVKFHQVTRGTLEQIQVIAE